MRLLVINDVSTVWGGATKVAMRCIEAATSAGMECTALVGDDGAGIRARFPQVQVEALGEKPLREGAHPGDVFSRNFNGRAYRALGRLLSGGSQDMIVHVHGWSQILSPSIFHALARHRANVVLTTHDFFLTCPNGGYVNYQRGDICHVKPLSMSCLASNCDKRNYLHKLWRFARSLTQQGAGEAFWSRIGVILAHEAMEPYLRAGPFRNFLTLRTPAEPLSRNGRVRAWDNDRILYLGRMTWEKGVRTLAEALNATGSPATLIGQGPLLREIRQALPHCWVAGWLEDDEVARIASETRYVIMPSRMPEPYGLVAAEALMCGIPVIVSSNALIAEEIARNGAGLVFESGNAQSLAEKIALMRSDDLVRHLSDGAFAYARKIAPTWSEWSGRIVDIYTGKTRFISQ
ncbi:glycosyltransferase family 4 protein [Chelativorans sp. AA-79]|uniref:glycosyltransferase family 4 protein n=1 Tax=Chelativorans sp. AA-79 TaxID=3028735 RepID=UPI0023F7910F|nr:glycosyltransferase family 4 protein [Chelativorans sp. AA-79]WEX08873.1 glycosyltransferase family 4 protein [Chelativorans sp. AA-79]